jgi:dienelactone hydrolase
MSAELVLLHSALGRRPAVLRAADRLRQAGHVVHVPDLYEGAVFDAADAGVAHADSIGWSTLLDRARGAVDALPSGLVYLGWSMGAGLAQTLVTARPGARGAVLLHGGSAFELEKWPAIPVAVHHAVDDPWVDEGEPAAVVTAAARAGASGSLHVYPGAGHLFDDDEHDDHAPEPARLMWARIELWLDALPD